MTIMVANLLKIFILALLIYLLEMPAAWLPDSPLPGHIIPLIGNFLVFVLAADLATRLLAWLYRRHMHLPRQQSDTVVIGLRNVYYLLVAGALVFTVLGFYRIDFHTIFTTLSIVAAAIAIVSKDYISEIISGIIISFSREVRIGDYIILGNHKGKVIDLTLTKIALLNEDDDIIFLPNNKVFSNELINYTKRATSRVSIEFEVGFQHISTVEELESALISALEKYREDIITDSFYLRIVDINKDSLVLKFHYTIKRHERELERRIRKQTVRRVVNYVKENWYAGEQKGKGSIKLDPQSQEVSTKN